MALEAAASVVYYIADPFKPITSRVLILRKLVTGQQVYNLSTGSRRTSKLR
jgi:hypothetical protein